MKTKRIAGEVFAVTTPERMRALEMLARGVERMKRRAYRPGWEAKAESVFHLHDELETVARLSGGGGARRRSKR